MKKSLYLSLMFMCIASHAYANDVSTSDALQSVLDDDFFNALREASEQTQEPALNDAEQAMNALAEMQKQDTVQEPSRMQKYALAALVKALIYYGTCKTYITNWISYFASYFM